MKKIIFVLILGIFLISLVSAAPTNTSVLYGSNGTDTIPLLTNPDGTLRVNMDLLNITANNLTVIGNQICNATACFNFQDLNNTGVNGANSTFNQSFTDGLYVDIGGDNMTGMLNMSNNNITSTGTGFFGWLGSLLNRVTKLFVQDIDASGNINVTGNVTVGDRIFFEDNDHWLTEDASERFTGVSDHAYWFHHDVEHPEGSVGFLVSAIGDGFNRTLIAAQIGLNNSAGIWGNSLMIMPNNLSENLSVSTNCFRVADQLGETLRVFCDTDDSGSDLLVHDDIQAFGTGFFEGGLRIENDATFNLRGHDADFINGTVYIATLQTFQKGFSTGDQIIVIDEIFPGNLGRFENLQVDFGNWIATTTVFCDEGDCAEASGAGLGNVIMEGNFSTVNINNTYLSFLYSLTNIKGSDSFTVTINNNTGSGDVVIFTDSTDDVLLSSQVISLTENMSNGSVISLRFECDASSANRFCFVDTVHVNGTAMINTLANQTGFDGQIGFGDGTKDASGIFERGIYYNASADQIQFRGNVTFQNVEEQTINVTTSIILNNTEIFDWISINDTSSALSINTTVNIQNLINGTSDALTLNGKPDSHFMPDNTSVVGSFDFNGGWTNEGISIIGGDVYVQTLYAYNISGLDVTTLSVNGSLLPAVGFDNTFDIGSGSLRWKDLYLGGQVYSNGTGDNWFLGSVGIGTGSPSTLLEIKKTVAPGSGANAALTISGYESPDADAQLGDGVQLLFKVGRGTVPTIGASIDAVKASGTDLSSNTDLVFSTSQDDETLDEAMRIDDAGKVGIGTDSPDAKLHILSDSVVQDDANYNAIIMDTSAQAAGVGGGLIFGGKYTDGGTYTNFAGIWGAKEDGTTGNFGGELGFWTRPNGGGFIEAMRIDAAGKVGIGTSNPIGKLDINTSTNSNAILIREDTDGSLTHNIFIDGSDDAGMIMYSNGESPKIQFLADGISYFNGGNVGIGTASPGFKLDVVGKIKGTSAEIAETFVGIIFNETDQAGAAGLFRLEGTSGTFQIARNTAAGGDFSTRTTPFIIQADDDAIFSGNVGIGTSGVQELLHVMAPVGTTAIAKIEGGNSTVVAVGEINAQLEFGSHDGSVQSPLQVGGMITSVTEINNGAWVGMGFHTYDQTGGAAGLTEKMRITRDGNVGIGITTPNAPLDISSSDDAYPAIESSTKLILATDNTAAFDASMLILAPDESILYFGDYDSMLSGRIRYVHGSDSMIFHTNGTVAMTLLPDIFTTGDQGIQIANDTRLGFEESGVRSWTMKADGGDLNFRSGDNLGTVNILTAGVGIGTDSPSLLLSVFHATTDALVNITSGDDTVRMRLGDDDTEGIISVNADKGMYFGFSTDDDKMVINTGGNVGIGVNKPGYKLSIGGSGLLELNSNAPYMVFNETENNHAWFWVADGNEFGLRNGTVGSADFIRVESNGEVGIGTSNPDVKLEVAGTIKSTGAVGAFVWKDSTAGEDDFTAQANSDVLEFLANTERNILTLMGDTHANAGNVGIGTNAPSAKLAIENNINGFDNDGHLELFNPRDTAASTFAGINFRANGSGEGKAWFGFTQTASYGRGDFVFLLDGAVDDTSVSTADEVVRITKDGRLVIGTSSTSFPFHVYENSGGTGPLAVLENVGSGDSAIGFRVGAPASLLRWMVGIDNSDGDAFKITYSSLFDGSNEFLRIGNDTGSVSMEGLSGTYTNGEAAVCTYDNGTLFVRDGGCN